VSKMYIPPIINSPLEPSNWIVEPILGLRTMVHGTSSLSFLFEKEKILNDEILDNYTCIAPKKEEAMNKDQLKIKMGACCSYKQAVET